MICISKDKGELHMSLGDFGERFAGLRKERGFTQDVLAIRLGVTPQAISKWERGNSYPDIDLLCTIAQVLDCSIDHLLNAEVKNRLIESDDKIARKRLMQNILAEPFVFETGIGLVDLLIEEKNNDYNGIQSIREKLAEEYGILIPLVRIKDNTKLGEFEYRFLSYDKVIATKTVASKEAITIEDIYGELEEVYLTNYSQILNRQIVKALVDNLADKYPAVVIGIIPDKITLSILQKVLSKLVQNKKSIHNLIKIVEILEDNIENTQNIDVLVKLAMEQL